MFSRISKRKTIIFLSLMFLMSMISGYSKESVSRVIDTTIDKNQADFSGESALGYANSYTSFGLKRTGTETQQSSAQWILDELISMGISSEIQEINFRQFDLTKCSLLVDGTEIASFPYWFPQSTPEEGVSGPLVMYSESTDLKDKIVVYDLPGLASVSDISEIANYAVGAGAKALIVAVLHSAGVNAQNAVEEYVEKELPLPAVIFSKENLENITTLAEQSAEATVVITGNINENGTTGNVVAKIDNQSNKWIIITTPISGWFTCHAERGAGVGMFLELARVLPTHIKDANLLFLGTTGHELNFLGAHAYESQLPSAEDTLLWVHLGSAIAAKEPIVANYKFIGCSEDLHDSIQEAFGTMEDLFFQEDEEKLMQSELGKVIQDGYTTFGLFGANKAFHTVEDTASGIDETQLGQLGKASQDFICDLLEQ